MNRKIKFFSFFFLFFLSILSTHTNLTLSYQTIKQFLYIHIYGRVPDIRRCHNTRLVELHAVTAVPTRCSNARGHVSSILFRKGKHENMGTGLIYMWYIYCRNMECHVAVWGKVFFSSLAS